MPLHRYYFQIKKLSIFDLVWAANKLDAQHKLINSPYAPFYREIEWLSNDSDYSAKTVSKSHSDSAMEVVHWAGMSKSIS